MSTLQTFTDDGWLWERYDPDGYVFRGVASLLRNSLTREPGTVPAMWRHHRVDVPYTVAQSGFGNPYHTAEHYALTLYGVHQHGRSRSMHQPGQGLGRALKRLSHQVTSDRVERIMNGLTVSSTVHGLARTNLHPIVRLLAKYEIGLDYTQLLHHLYFWQRRGDGRKIALRAWSTQYFSSFPAASAEDTDTATGVANTTEKKN